MFLKKNDFNIKSCGLMSFKLLPKKDIHKVTFVDDNVKKIAIDQYYINVKDQPILAYYFKIDKIPFTIYF